MTAEEFWQKFYTEQIDEDTADGAIWEYKYDIKQLMIEFAQHHVKQALRKASNYNFDSERYSSYEMEEMVLNAYPDDRIK